MTTETAITKRDPDMPPAPILAERPPTALLPTRGDLEAMALIAGQAIKAAGMIPAALKTKEQALAVMLAGWELGLRPMTSLRHVYVVNGKTEIETRAMVGIIRARDPRIKFAWPEYTSEAVTCVISREGQPDTKVRYTVEDATKSGQMAKGGVWKQYTRDMLYAAATKRACRLACPDLINAIEGAMVTEQEATSLHMADAEVRVVDAMPAEIPADAYNEGDEGGVAVEVETPAHVEQDERREAQHRTSGPTAQGKANPKAEAMALIKQAHASDDAEAIKAELIDLFPDIFDANGTYVLSEATVERVGEVATFLRTRLANTQGALA